MQKRKVNLTQEAIYDIAEIAERIELEFTPERADRFQADMKDKISTLEMFAGGFGHTNLLYRDYVIHKLPFPPSIIFYVINEEEVSVLRVLREEQDWDRILKENPEVK